MGNEGSYRSFALKTWNAQIDRADKRFGGLAVEEDSAGVPQAKNRLSLLWDIFDSRTRTRAPAIVAGERLNPDLMSTISKTDTIASDIPSHEQVRQAWSVYQC